MGRLVATFAQLEANPRETIEALGRRYGIAQEADPRVADLENIVQQIHASEWGSFVYARDKNGAPLYPGAANLRERVGHELRLRPEQPGESTRDALVRAYDAVKWSDPQLRQSLLAERDRASAAERLRKADLERAKRAGTSAPRAKTAPGENIRSAKGDAQR
jgi:hypothetical protein